MSATKENARVAAAFQGGKDPQQDAILQWLGTLPKDDRGGIRRSVMKYHLTQALLLYINQQNPSMRAQVPTAVQPGIVPRDSAPVTPVRTSPPAVSNVASNSGVVAKPPNSKLRSKIATSMASAK